MKFRDYLRVSGGNIRRMKFRASLTIAGIIIAISAFVTMLTFGAGNQAYITKQYNDLGLFTTMQVFPKNRSDDRRGERFATRDTGATKILDMAAIQQLARIPGVNLVYPYDPLNARVHFHDSTFDTRAQSLPYTAAQTKLFTNLVAGREFSSDSARSALVSTAFIKKAGVNIPDSALGKKIVLSVRVSVLDSGLAHILVDRSKPLWNDAKNIKMDSLLRSPSYRRTTLNVEVNEVVKRFFNGYMNAQQTLTDTLTICGVIDRERQGPLRIEDLIVPAGTAKKLSATGFSGNPADMFATLSTGNFSLLPSAGTDKTFTQVTLDLDPHVLNKSVRDSVAALGFRSFSFAEQFEQIQQFFLYFDMGLGIVGLIALATASLGIVNTMVMSVSERRKEIGILKSLGADDVDIRNLFLIESGVMGAVGTVMGILTGWGASRIISAVVKFYMKRQSLPEVELFALPFWLIGIALAVGIGVSVLAGTFPAARAARVDPVEALRND